MAFEARTEGSYGALSESDSEMRCEYRDCEKSATARVIGVDGSDYGIFCWRHSEQLTSPGDKLAALDKEDKEEQLEE